MSDDSQSPPRPPRARPFDVLRKPLFIFSLLFLAWILFGQAATRFLPQHGNMPVSSVVVPKVQPTPQAMQDKDAQIADLQRRLADIEAKIKTTDNVSTMSVKPSDDGAAAAKIAALQASLDASQQAHSAAAGDTAHVTEALHKQEEELSALKAQLADTQTQALHRLSLIAAFNTLKDTIMRGESFAEPLNRMNDLAKGDDAIQSRLMELAPYAKDNTTLALLQSQFEATIPKSLAAGDTNSLTRHLQSMIRIRKVGEQQTGNSNEAIIARAEAKLNRGDVKACVDELTTLSPSGATAFAAWNKKAQAFLHTRDVLDALQPVLLQEKPVASTSATQTSAKP